MTKQPIIKLGLLIVIIGGLSLILARTNALNWIQNGGIDATSFQTQLLFASLVGLVSVTLLPTSPLLIASGYLFGPLLGGTLCLAGLTLGALIAFGLTRYCLYDVIRTPLFNRFPKLATLDQSVQRNGLLVAIGIRFVPIPAWAINYGLSLSPIRWVDYAVGSSIGLAPVTFIIANIGSNLANINSVNFIVSIGIYILFLLGIMVYRKAQS
jgi:uncharacterized membrane protein YdjX (TVP38/TMEM64 family)